MKTKKLIACFFLSISILGLPHRSYSWGAQGHRLIVETALSLISPKAKQKVLAALGTKYSSDLAAVWMDSVRINKIYKYKYMKNWHFLNMETNQTYPQVANHNDVVFNLQRVMDAFNQKKKLSSDSLKQNLRILFHLMGDITQPLHCGYGSDLGGNLDMVSTPKYDMKGNNLHHVWDDVMIDEGHINQQVLLTYCNSLTAAQSTAVKQGNATSWMQQSRSYLPAVYACHLKKKRVTVLTLKYLDGNVPVVKKQLSYAAIRLADVLQRYFGS
ncbi:MAG: nuclease [Mucilaginibacter sp.]|nr:nuclease [Mucilaginibacter sp.]